MRFIEFEKLTRSQNRQTERDQPVAPIPKCPMIGGKHYGNVGQQRMRCD